MIFYIYGSGYIRGSALEWGPEYFMNRNIVLVTFNYRLGALGFLSTGDTVIAGNMALKDQVMAMKWTKENIYDFGGDNRRVTLHGHSAGSMSIHLHTMSPLSKGEIRTSLTHSAFFLKMVCRLIRCIYRLLQPSHNAKRLEYNSYQVFGSRDCESIIPRFFR